MLVVAGFFLAAAMKRVHGWQSMAWPARWVAITFFAVASPGCDVRPGPQRVVSNTKPDQEAQGKIRGLPTSRMSSR